jgi:hypothetical protein
MTKVHSGFERVNGIYQFPQSQERRLLSPGWHRFTGVDALVSGEGTHYRKAAVFVGEQLSLPEHLCVADDSVAEHEARAAQITDGDVYTAGCHGSHDIQDFAQEVLASRLGVENISRADWAVCQGAAYHSDEVFSELFALFHITGTAGELHLPRLGCKVYLVPGSWVVFDCAEPHGFTTNGAQRFSARANVRNGITRFLNVGIAYDDAPTLSKALGHRLEYKGKALGTNDFVVNSLTGALGLSRAALRRRQEHI